MDKKKTLKTIIHYVGRYWPLLLCALLFGAIFVAMNILIPLKIGNAIDLIVGKNNVDFEGIKNISIEIFICIGVLFISQWLMSIINNHVAYKVVYDMRLISFKNLIHYPLSYLDKKRPGEIVSIVVNDVDTFADGLLMSFSQLFTGVCTIVGILAMMFYLNWILALGVLILTPLSLFIAKFISKKSYDMFKDQAQIKADQTGFIEEMISSLKTVKAYNHTKQNEVEFDKINDNLEKSSLKAIFYSSLVNPTTRFVYSLIYALVAIVGSIICIKKSDIGGVLFTIGMLSSFLAYTNQYTKPFNEITSVITELQNSIACASRVFELNKVSVEKEKEDAITLENVEGVLDAKNVFFGYSKDNILIKDFNLHVNKGEKIAIVGPTGCGKTTLINLLMRFYDVNSGDIEIDGVSIKDIKKDSLRKKYGMVLQDVWLKSGSIKDNIKMGKPDATDEQIVNAALATYSDSFIKKLENGYDTIINEDGEGLSLGQKQLLCITRVMLSLPPMLILDEATSSIDTRTELKIQNAFDKLMQGKTSFVVAHRLSTIKNADKILVMKDGNIIESGTHRELLDKKGFYFDLYNSQFEN